VLVAPLLEVDEQPGAERQAAARFTADLGVDEGWDRYNAYSWRHDYAGFVRFFFSQVFSEPHSTKPIEDCVGWGLETDAETLITAEVPGISAARVRELCARVLCPVLVVHGDQDAIVPHAIGVEAARLTGGRIVTFAGSGHGVPARDPVRFNLELRAFIAVPPPRATRWTRARARRKRVLYISSPIGLGHAQRDVAIAGELRKLHPGLEIDWLASIRSPRCWKRAASGSTRPARRWRVSLGTLSPSRPATTCTASRPSGGWMRSCSPTSWSSTTWSATRTTTCGSAMKPGSSTITCTKPRAEDCRLRLVHRLRRLAADARRR
jgi:TAP-like protein